MQSLRAAWAESGRTRAKARERTRGVRELESRGAYLQAISAEVGRRIAHRIRIPRLPPQREGGRKCKVSGLRGRNRVRTKPRLASVRVRSGNSNPEGRTSARSAPRVSSALHAASVAPACKHNERGGRKCKVSGLRGRNRVRTKPGLASVRVRSAHLNPGVRTSIPRSLRRIGLPPFRARPGTFQCTCAEPVVLIGVRYLFAGGSSGVTGKVVVASPLNTSQEL